MNKLFFAGMAAAVSLLATAAQASIVFSFAGPTGPLVSPGAAVGGFSGTGAATLKFQLDGYLSLDGDNYYKDVFTLNLNGTDIVSGTFDMGGGGANVVYFAPIGSVITPTSFGSFAGGKTIFSVPLSLTGSNTLLFSYDSPGGAFAGPQGTGDEAWGLRDITVNATGGVPEPASWALMIGGFGLAGAALRRRRAALAA